MAHSYQPHSIRSHHPSLSLRLGHTAGRVLELSRALGARTLTMARGKSDLPFYFGGARNHGPHVEWQLLDASATCSPTCPSLVISMFPFQVLSWSFHASGPQSSGNASWLSGVLGCYMTAGRSSHQTRIPSSNYPAFPLRGLMPFPALILGCNVYSVSSLFTASIYELLGDDFLVY